MNKPYETHACIICGCTEFIDYSQRVAHNGITYDGKPTVIIETRRNNNPHLEACTLCGTVRDMNIVNERYKEKRHEEEETPHESTDKR